MPKVTIWIRNEDEAKWKAIENKPAWLHIALNRGFFWPEHVHTAAKESGALADNIPLKSFVEFTDRLSGSHVVANEPNLTPPEEAA